MTRATLERDTLLFHEGHSDRPIGECRDPGCQSRCDRLGWRRRLYEVEEWIRPHPVAYATVTGEDWVMADGHQRVL